jgi:hypothetical protein
LRRSLFGGDLSDFQVGFGLHQVGFLIEQIRLCRLQSRLEEANLPVRSAPAIEMSGIDFRKQLPLFNNGIVVRMEHGNLT